MTGKPSLKCLTAFLLLLFANSHLFAQEKIVTGKVKDPQGNPLPGVNVNVWGSRQSVSADVTGSFSIPVPSGNSTLVFSFVGFLQQEVKVGEQSDLQVTMAYDNADLDQVVVVGYGTQRRRDLTGSVYSVKPNVITQAPTFNALEAIQGRVPGLDIQRSGGGAGAGVNIQVRGQRTISGTGINGTSGPLYVIDGFQGGNIMDLNPNDIESIEVLKDASATAIYGWMGADGVIIVTTKKGKEKPKVSYNGYYGVNGYVSYPQTRMGDDYVKLRREAWRTVGLWDDPSDDDVLFPDAGELAAYRANKWVNWFDLLSQNGIQQSHTASIQSGSDKTKIFFSTGYYKEEGMLRNNDMSRYNARFNYDQRISNSFKAGLYSQITYVDHDRRADPLSAANTLVPLGDPYDQLGQINLIPLTPGKASPLGDERPNVFKDNEQRINLMTNGYLEFTPINGLSFRTNLGTNFTFSKRGTYADSLSFYNYAKSTRSGVENSFQRFLNWDNIITFTRKIEDHSITLTGITSYIESITDNSSGFGIRQLLSSQGYYNLNSTEAISRELNSQYTKFTTMSYAGRLNYAFKGKYLVTASLRADGVSRLAPGNKWDYFPSAAVGWNIHQEGFMTNALFVNNLKLRASYGVAGNANIAPYGTQSTLLFRNNQGFGDVTGPVYYFNPTAGNTNLGWEKTATANLGLDFAFFKSRFYGTVEVYKGKTTDILLLRTLPPSSGITNVYQNVGETENKGIEIALSSVNANTADFKWTSTLTYTAGREKITKLINDKDIIDRETNSLLLGHPVSSFYSYEKLGIWQTDEAAKASQLKTGTYSFQPGDIKLLDVNGDSLIDAKDRKFLGSRVPKWFAGFQNTFAYKGFELSIYVFARWGQMINAEFMGRYNPSGLGNGPSTFNYWTPENATNDFPRPRKDATVSNYVGYTGYLSLNYIDGSYFKIKTVTLAYNLPSEFTRRLYMDKVRIYATGNNIFTKAKNHLLTDYDPERGGSESSPLTRQVVVGLNVDF